MNDHPPHIKETCHCGADIDVTAPAAEGIVERWRVQHPHGAPADRGQGAGFAVTTTATVPRQPWGHINQEVRA